MMPPGTHHRISVFKTQIGMKNIEHAHRDMVCEVGQGRGRADHGGQRCGDL
jgi:hypothetical protein